MSGMNEGKLNVFGDTCVDYVDNVVAIKSHGNIDHDGFVKLSSIQNNIHVLPTSV